MPRKTPDQWFDEYGESHQNRVNKLVHWVCVPAIAGSIGEKGIPYAAKVLAVTAIDLLEDPRQIAAAEDDFKLRMKDRTYFSFIPKGRSAPQPIR